MRKDVKLLADAMEKGWKMCPKMMDGWGYFRGKRRSSPEACCAKGHAFLGQYGDAMFSLSVDVRFAAFLAFKQLVLDEAGEETDLFTFLNELSHEYGWTTPQIVKWLRSHQND